ncbi:alpha/beta fold hydrolase [Kocuria sp.]|uniref:alpha/beta hydrolase family protein n=1 Tax=Kocuria sp. TaxID=1871328 RepID=UPI0026DA9D98|nr:alpha/beta fold hydrolase [Kocuria sp.]MDO4919608.1 chlorophyllase [Kocuria sp.]
MSETSPFDPSVDSGGIPVGEATPVCTVRPITMNVPERRTALEVAVTFPVAGTDLPVIIFSHGHGPSGFVGSMYGYDPLVNFWAAHGFVVVRPNHLDANYLGLREASDPDAPLYLRERAHDIVRVLDHLREIEDAVPGLQGRIDCARIAAVGHSAGGNTIGAVSGMMNVDPTSGSVWGETEERISARVLMAAPGRGSDLDGQVREIYPALTGTDFSHMTPPALIVTGENDAHPFFASRSSWRSDAFTDSPGPKTHLIMAGAEHMLGGISGFDAAETSDEDRDRVAVVRAMVVAYLRSELDPGDDTWQRAVDALDNSATSRGHVESK